MMHVQRRSRTLCRKHLDDTDTASRGFSGRLHRYEAAKRPEDLSLAPPIGNGAYRRNRHLEPSGLPCVAKERALLAAFEDGFLENSQSLSRSVPSHEGLRANS